MSRWWIWDELTGIALGRRDPNWGGGFSKVDPFTDKQDAVRSSKAIGDGGLRVVTQEELDRIMIQQELEGKDAD
jgi:hypothetical protein